MHLKETNMEKYSSILLDKFSIIPNNNSDLFFNAISRFKYTFFSSCYKKYLIYFVNVISNSQYSKNVRLNLLLSIIKFANNVDLSDDFDDITFLIIKQLVMIFTEVNGDEDKHDLPCLFEYLNTFFPK